jgi:hypothetical protein
MARDPPPIKANHVERARQVRYAMQVLEFSLIEFRLPHYAHIRPELDRARTIMIDETLWPHSKTIDISVSNAEFIEDALTELAERCAAGELHTLESRWKTVVLFRSRYRSKSSAPCKLVTLNHRKLRRLLIDHFKRGNFSAS